MASTKDDEDVVLRVDYIDKQPDNLWKHGSHQFQGNMDGALASTWNDKLSQVLTRVRGKGLGDYKDFLSVLETVKFVYINRTNKQIDA